MKRVCFCVRGHAVEYAGFMQPANCSLCNAPVDIYRPSMSLEEAEKKGLLNNDNAQKPAAEQEASPAPAAPPAPAPGTGMFGQPPPTTPAAPPAGTSMFGQPRPAAPGTGTFGQPPPTTPAAPPAGTSAFGQPRPAATGMGAFGQPPPSTPAAPPAFGGRPASAFGAFSSTPAQASGYAQPSAFGGYASPGFASQNQLYISIFGSREPVPQEGGWIGREGIGQKWLEGCLLISRKHVHIKQNSSDTLLLGPDHSLNGVSYDAGNGQTTLKPNETVEIPVGSTIWLYNIPLKLESE